MPLSSESFDSPAVVPCPAPLRTDAHRALVGATREVERSLEHLQRRALEIGTDGFAVDLGWVAEILAATRQRLELDGGRR